MNFDELQKKWNKQPEKRYQYKTGIPDQNQNRLPIK